MPPAPSRPRSSHRPSAQHGQAAVLVLLFVGILLISLNFLYKQGRITSDRMQLQNAADAIAYSISVTEARDLNFAAYLNRAMVANEVAIGQLMGLASWAFHWKSFADFLMFYDSTVIGPATLGISTPIMQSVTNIMFRIPGESVFIPVLSALANFGTTALHVINKFYGLAQFGYHTVSAIFSIGTISEMLEQNAPPGARISELGIASLIAHFASYGSVPLPVPGGSFTTSYNPAKTVPRTQYDAGEKGEMEGYERFAALVRDSRDPFTMERGWRFGLFTLPPVRDIINSIGTNCIDPIVCGSAYVDKNGAINFELGYTWDLGIFGVEWEVHFFFGMNLARDGGSELRLIVPATAVSGSDFNWSSADTTVLEVFAGGGFNIEAFVRLFGKRITVFDFGASISVGGERLVIAVNVNGSASACQDKVDADGNPVTDADGNVEQECESAGGSEGLEIVNIPFPTSAPFGAGFAEAGTTAKNNLRRIPHMTRKSLGGQVPNKAYGRAASRTLAWDSTLPAPPGIAMSADIDARHMVNKGYRGLPRYIDTTGNDTTLLGFGAPHLLMSLVLDEDEYDKDRGNPARDHPEMTGVSGAYRDLKLEERFANDQIHTVARSEVYFSRPNDLSYFARADGQEEYGNAFNPYWNARLTETRYVDRIVANLVQQQQDFTGTSEVFDLIDGVLEDFLP